MIVYLEFDINDEKKIRGKLGKCKLGKGYMFINKLLYLNR